MTRVPRLPWKYVDDGDIACSIGLRIILLRYCPEPWSITRAPILFELRLWVRDWCMEVWDARFPILP